MQIGKKGAKTLHTVYKRFSQSLYMKNSFVALFYSPKTDNPLLGGSKKRPNRLLKC